MKHIILISAAGEGSRFRSQGLLTPKPLIRVAGKSLLEHTLESFDMSQVDYLIIAVQSKHNVDTILDSCLKKKFIGTGVEIVWVKINELLPGQLATSVYACNEFIIRYQHLSKSQLFIHNCDTGFHWSDELGILSGWACMPVFEAEGDHWSFGLPDDTNSKIAMRIEEKKRISNLASIGLYGFKSISSFYSQADSFLKRDSQINNEYYIAPMLQKAIENNKVVTLPRVNGIKLYGTPDELCTTFGISLEELKLENKSSSPTY